MIDAFNNINNAVCSFLHINPYIQGVVVLLCINIIAILGMAVLTGFTRLFSFGNAGFMAIGAYAAAMGGLDVIVFTAGVGENQVSMRSEVCKNMEFLGVKFDESKNSARGEEAIISADDSKVKVVVIPTDEELMIATDTMNLL